MEITLKSIASPFRNSYEKEKKKQKFGDDLSFCVLNTLPEVSTLPSLTAMSLLKREVINFECRSFSKVFYK